MLEIFAEEWPLLLFTLFAQLAIGTYIFIVIIRSFQKKVDREMSINITKRGLLLVGPTMLVALVLSVFHLGVPLNAYLSVSNLASSWLSREILFAGIFFAFWALSFFLDWKNKWNQIVGWLTSAIGLGAVYSMASIYAATIFPAWTDVNTYLAFFGTTILLGVMAAMLILLMSKQAAAEGYSSILKAFGLVGLAAIVVQLIYLPVYVAGLPINGGEAGYQSAALLTGTYAVTTVIRWILSIVGLIIIGYAFIKMTSTKPLYSLYFTAVGLVLAGEFLGRLIFYTSGLHI